MNKKVKALSEIIQQAQKMFISKNDARRAGKACAVIRLSLAEAVEVMGMLELDTHKEEFKKGYMDNVAAIDV